MHSVILMLTKNKWSELSVDFVCNYNKLN